MGWFVTQSEIAKTHFGKNDSTGVHLRAGDGGQTLDAAPVAGGRPAGRGKAPPQGEQVVAGGPRSVLHG